MTSSKRTSVYYYDALPGVGKTHWAIDFLVDYILKREKGQAKAHCVYYAAPTVRLIEQTIEEVNRRLSELPQYKKLLMRRHDGEISHHNIEADIHLPMRLYSKAPPEAEFGYASSPVHKIMKDMKKHPTHYAYRIVYVTHESFVRYADILPETENSILLFDEARQFAVTSSDLLQNKSLALKKALSLLKGFLTSHCTGVERYEDDLCLETEELGQLPSYRATGEISDKVGLVRAAPGKCNSLKKAMLETVRTSYGELHPGHLALADIEWFNKVFSLIDSIKGGRALLYIDRPEAEANNCKNLLLLLSPADIFSSFKSAYVLGAFMLDSQMVHLLRMSPNIRMVNLLEHDKQLRVKDRERRAQIKERYKSLRIVNVFPVVPRSSLQVYSQYLVFRKSKTAKNNYPDDSRSFEFFQTAKDLNLSINSSSIKKFVRLMRAAFYHDHSYLYGIQQCWNTDSKLVIRAAKSCGFGKSEVNFLRGRGFIPCFPLEYIIKRSITLMRATKGDSKTLVSINPRHFPTFKRIVGQLLEYDLLSGSPHGLNGHMHQNTLLLLSAINTPSYMQAMLADLIPSYDASVDITVGAAIQAITRTSLRDTSIDSEVTLYTLGTENIRMILEKLGLDDDHVEQVNDGEAVELLYPFARTKGPSVTKDVQEIIIEAENAYASLRDQHLKLINSARMARLPSKVKEYARLLASSKISMLEARKAMKDLKRKHGVPLVNR
jgi:hypothetical protein